LRSRLDKAENFGHYAIKNFMEDSMSDETIYDINMPKHYVEFIRWIIQKDCR
jgi:hypothetical protein